MTHYKINKGTPNLLAEAFAKAMHEYEHGTIGADDIGDFTFEKEKIDKANETLRDYLLQKFTAVMSNPEISKDEIRHLRCLFDLICNGDWEKFKRCSGLEFSK